MSISNSRVASRYLLAEGDVWLPDFLGSSAPVADLTMTLIKHLVAEVGPDRTNPASVAGGIFYKALQLAHLSADAEQMFRILDQNAGLNNGEEMGRPSRQVLNALMRGRDDREAPILIGALGVELLQRTRQPRKAKAVNKIFSQKYADILATMSPGRGEAPSPPEILRSFINDNVKKTAAVIAKRIAKDPAKALWAIEHHLTDINFHSLARHVSSLGPVEQPSDPDIKYIIRNLGNLGYGIEYGVAFGVALLELVAPPTAHRFEALAMEAGQRNGLFTHRLASDVYSGNPSGEGIYPNEIDHGYTEPLAGGTDVMRKLQNQFLHEQGREQRPDSPRLARGPLNADKLSVELAHLESDLNALKSMVQDSRG